MDTQKTGDAQQNLNPGTAETGETKQNTVENGQAHNIAGTAEARETPQNSGTAETGETQQNAEDLSSEFYDRIQAAFELFDNEGNRTVERSEIGTIMRWLGCVPTQADITEAIAELEQKDNPGVVSFDKFLHFMTRVLVENKYQPASSKELLRAFQALDVANKTVLTQEELATFMKEEGETMTNEEVEEMLSAAVNTADDRVDYKDYIKLLLVE